ncbi:MAG: type III pantothenate kinase [Lachnospiraceae bacterium]|nr:type III pantothenate kinase [Lachnospiraceae bacterium]
MLLAIDVGNTNLTFCVFEGQEIKVSFRITTKLQRTSDEFVANIHSQLELKKICKDDINAVIIASVVPGLMHSLTNACLKYFGITPMIVSASMNTGIVIDIANPKEAGADRIVDLVAAYELYGGPVLVCDFGTATTYDLITAKGEFIAGVTSPGIKICANALWNETAKLPEIEIALPNTILAKDTVTSMQAGLVFGYIGQTEYICRKMIEESALGNVKVVATGGLGRMIAENTDIIDVYDSNLTMKGLEILYRKNA